MKQVFADTSYWLAITHPNDSFHKKANSLSKKLTVSKIITTDLVLGEFLNHHCEGGQYWRGRVAKIVDTILSNRDIEVVYCSKDSFRTSLKYYYARPDKGYSFTDCFSMVIIEQNNISEVLTADHHFEQEGFVRLLK